MSGYVCWIDASGQKMIAREDRVDFILKRTDTGSFFIRLADGNKVHAVTCMRYFVW